MISAIILIVILLVLSFIFESKRTICFSSENKRIRNTKIIIRRKTLFLFCIFSLFFFLLAFKDLTVGNDSKVYSDLFYDIAKGYLKANSRYEIGYIWLNKILSYIYPYSRILFIVSALFISYSYAIFIKKYSYSIWFSIMLFLLLECFDLSANLLRQAISIGILLFAFPNLLNKKIFNFILLVVLGGLFHSSAYIFLILLITPYLKLTKVNIFIFILILGLTFYVSNLLVNYLFANIELYADYANSDYALGGTRIASVINSLIISFVLLFSLSQRSQIEKDNITRISFWIVSIGELFLVISFSFNQIGRISKIFTVFTIILLPNVLWYIKKKSPLRYFIYCSFWLILWIAQFLIIIYFRPEWNGIYPYKFCF